MSHGNATWTPDQDEILRTMWEQGKPFSAIAKAIGGISRNAAIGRAHRLGLRRSADGVRRSKAASGRAAGQRASGRKPRPPVNTAPIRKARSGPPEMPVEALPPPEPPPEGVVPLLDLRPGQCRWPYGDGPFLLCAQPVAGTLSYCAYHASVAYVPAPKRTRSPESIEKQRATMRRKLARAALEAVS